MSEKLYHVSERVLGTYLSPRVPRNWLIDKGYEDGRTRRVVASTSIEGALRGMSKDLEGSVLHVYRLESTSKIVAPSKRQVPDCEITQERWILGVARAIPVGTIKVGSALGEGIVYYYDEGLRAKLYDWEYEVLQYARGEALDTKRERIKA